MGVMLKPLTSNSVINGCLEVGEFLPFPFYARRLVQLLPPHAVLFGMGFTGSDGNWTLLCRFGCALSPLRTTGSRIALQIWLVFCSRYLSSPALAIAGGAGLAVQLTFLWFQMKNGSKSGTGSVCN
jgi:hypothetical protein